MTSERAKDIGVTLLYVLAIIFVAAAIIILIVDLAMNHTVSVESRDNAIILGVVGLIFIIVTYLATGSTLVTSQHK